MEINVERAQQHLDNDAIQHVQEDMKRNRDDDILLVLSTWGT